MDNKQAYIMNVSHHNKHASHQWTNVAYKMLLYFTNVTTSSQVVIQVTHNLQLPFFKEQIMLATPFQLDFINLIST